MSTNIFITGLQQLQRRLQQATEANRQAALERQARDVRLQVFASTPTSPVNVPVRPIRSLLKGAGPTAQRGQQRRVFVAVPPTTEWNGFWHRIYSYNETVGDVLGTPLTGSYRFAEITSRDGTSSDVYEFPFNGLPNTNFTVVSGVSTTGTWPRSGPNQSGTAQAIDETHTITTDITYLLLPIDNDAVLFCFGVRGMYQLKRSETNSSFSSGDLVSECTGETFSYPYTETVTVASTFYDYETWEDYVGWRIDASTVTRLTSLPTGVVEALSDCLASFSSLETASSTGPATTTIERIHDPEIGNFCNFPATTTTSGSATDSTQVIQSTAAVQRDFNQFSTADRYRSFNQLTHYAGSGSFRTLTVSPGAYRVYEDIAQAESLRNADTADVLLAFSGEPVPAFSRVPEPQSLDVSEAEDIANGLATHPPVPVANWPLPECRYNRMDFDTYDPTGVADIALGVLAEPPPEVTAMNVSDVTIVAYWDWDQPAYCRTKAEAMGFTSVHLDPP